MKKLSLSRNRLLLTVAAVFVCTTATFASWGMSFGYNGSKVLCYGGVEQEGPNYLTVYLRIYSPSMQLLAMDAVATGSVPYVHTSISATPVGSGTYTCIGQFDDGATFTTDTQYVSVP